MVVYTRIHLVIVSIHTPTQGVTTSIMYPAQASQFQSTHPRRVWLQQQSSVQNSISFNPHTHAGCDLFIISFISERSVSIHTPTQGVTYLSFPSFQNGVFQSTHPRRVWRCYSILQCVRQSFNPHTHAGCDSIHHVYQINKNSFNPHTHAGCDIGFLFLILMIY